MTPNAGEASVIWQVTMTLDGYIAAPGDEMSWVFEHIDPANPAGAEIPEQLGAVIGGRRSYDVGVRDGMDVYDGSWSGAQFLMTHRPSDELPQGLRVRSGAVADVVAEALAAANGLGVGIIGADIARQALEADAIDEIIVHIVPALFGDGVRFRGTLGKRELRLIDTTQHGDIVTAHYRVPKQGSAS